MSKKKIDPGVLQVLTNELKGASAFFHRDDRQKHAPEAQKTASETLVLPQPVAQPIEPEKPAKEEPSAKTVTPRYRDTTTPRNHDTVTPSTVENIRKAVKLVGKEAATHRFTPEEKKAIADIVYTYGRQGYKTSENEIARIGINWMIWDYQEHGSDSVLEKVLKALKQ